MKKERNDLYIMDYIQHIREVISHLLHFVLALLLNKPINLSYFHIQLYQYDSIDTHSKGYLNIVDFHLTHDKQYTFATMARVLSLSVWPNVFGAIYITIVDELIMMMASCDGIYSDCCYLKINCFGIHYFACYKLYVSVEYYWFE